MESSIPGFGERVGPECLEKLLSHEVLLLRSRFKRSGVFCIIAIVNDHVVTSPDESIVLETTKPGHVPTIVASGVRESHTR